MERKPEITGFRIEWNYEILSSWTKENRRTGEKNYFKDKNRKPNSTPL